MNFRSRFFKHATVTSLTIATLGGMKASKYDELTVDNAADMGKTIGFSGAINYISARLSGESILSCFAGSVAGASLTILMASYYLMIYPKSPGSCVVAAGIASASLSILLDKCLPEQDLPRPLERRLQGR